MYAYTVYFPENLKAIRYFSICSIYISIPICLFNVYNGARLQHTHDLIKVNVLKTPFLFPAPCGSVHGPHPTTGRDCGSHTSRHRPRTCQRALTRSAIKRTCWTSSKQDIILLCEQYSQRKINVDPSEVELIQAAGRRTGSSVLSS